VYFLRFGVYFRFRHTTVTRKLSGDNCAFRAPLQQSRHLLQSRIITVSGKNDKSIRHQQALLSGLPQPHKITDINITQLHSFTDTMRCGAACSCPRACSPSAASAPNKRRHVPHWDLTEQQRKRAPVRVVQPHSVAAEGSQAGIGGGCRAADEPCS
jgi:hypothetical protein